MDSSIPPGALVFLHRHPLPDFGRGASCAGRFSCGNFLGRSGAQTTIGGKNAELFRFRAFRNWVSLDQFAAEQIGNRTRYPSLVLANSNEGQTLSYTRSGAPIPAEKSPKKLFQKLFVQGKPEEVAANVEAIKQGLKDGTID